MEELFDRLFYKAITHNVTDIHFILKSKLTIKMRMSGKLKLVEEVSCAEGLKFMNYLKYKANINTNYRLIPQTGQFEYMLSHHVYHLRLSYLCSDDFESIVIRILNQYSHITLDKFSPFSHFNSYISDIIHNRSGLITICGITGSGKTTLLYAILDKLIAEDDKNIISIEDPIEITKEGCLQIQLNELQGLDYETILKQILRHDPDVIVIGEIRDEKVAHIAITCALTGHLVLTTLHASSPYIAIKRLMNLGVHEFDLKDVLLASVSLKLVYGLDNQALVMPSVMTKSQIAAYFNHHSIEYIDYELQQRT